MLKEVQAANQYIQENSPQVKADYRNHYHLMAPIGWINDPNGLSIIRENIICFTNITLMIVFGDPCIGDMPNQKI